MESADDPNWGDSALVRLARAVCSKASSASLVASREQQQSCGNLVASREQQQSCGILVASREQQQSSAASSSASAAERLINVGLHTFFCIT
jgi:hypothetical protein